MAKQEPQGIVRTCTCEIEWSPAQPSRGVNYDLRCFIHGVIKYKQFAPVPRGQVFITVV